MKKNVIQKIMIVIFGLSMCITMFGGAVISKADSARRTGWFEWELVNGTNGEVEGAKIISFGPRVDADGNSIEEFTTPSVIEFPETIEGYKVVEIDGSYPWHGVDFSKIKTSIIPQYVKKICEIPGKIVVVEENPYFCSVDGVLYNKEKTELITYNWDGQESFIIPNTVKIIGEGALSGVGFDTITIPESVEVIKSRAFSSAALKEITIPKNVREIGKETFKGCKKLVKINFTNAVKIGEEAFYGSAVVNVSVPTGSIVSGNAFSGCENLKKLSLQKGAKWEGKICLTDTNLETFSLPKGTTEIAKYSFARCKKLKSVTIPASVKKISKNAFSGCSNLQKIKYSGTKKQWKRVKIAAIGNLCVKFAKIVTKNSTWKKKIKLTKKVKITDFRRTSSKTANIQWSKYVNADGYQLKFVSGKTKLRKNVTYVNEIPFETMKGLKKGTKYKAYVRYYVKIAGKTYYSGWSKGKSVKKN